MSLPLAGIKVVELCQILAGPFCGCLLADMGADVIKIEPPQGDPMRAWAPMREGYSQYFAALNRNKRSIALDLKSEQDRNTARELALSADIVIENFRPGVLARFGLDHATLQLERPALVYCSISAYGQTGPRAGDGGFDITLQAMSGLMSVTGEPDAQPVKCGVPIADSTAGLYAAFSAVAALHRAKQSGRGEYIDVSMLGSMLSIAHLQTSELFATGKDPRPLGSAHPTNAPYAAFRCSDGYIAIAAGTDKLWKSTCEALGRTDLVDHALFSSPALRGYNQHRLTALLSPGIARHARAELLEKLLAHGVPCAPLNKYSEALADPQVKHMEWVTEITLPSGTRTRTIASPLRIGGRTPPVYRSPPALGQHSAEVLRGTATTPRRNKARFRSFVADFTRLVERNPDEAEIFERGGRLLSDLVGQDDWLPSEYAQCHPEHYQQYLLHCDPLERFCVVSFVWGPGQRTPVHDHTVWGMIGMLRGAEIGLGYRRTSDGGIIADGNAHRLEPGQIDRVSPTIGDIHEVANAFDDRVSISIHVYGANIGNVDRHVYKADTGEVKSFVSGYSNGWLPIHWDRSDETASRSGR